MPLQNLFRTIRAGALIGIALALKHLMETNPRNYAAIGVNVVVFFFLFGVNHGFQRWFTLVLVGFSVYLACMYADSLTGSMGGPLIGRVNEASSSAIRKMFDMYQESQHHDQAAASAGQPLTHSEEMSLLKRLWRTKLSQSVFEDPLGPMSIRAQDAVRIVSEPNARSIWRWFL